MHRREFELQDDYGIWYGVDQPDAPVSGWSLFFYCSHCSQVYARMKSYVEEKRNVWKAVAGVCSRCWGYGDRWRVPGSISCGSWPAFTGLPLDVLLYELKRELAFYDHPSHPRFSLEATFS